MAIIIEVKVIPQSGKFKFQLDSNGALKCYLVSPPEDGKANKELVKGLAKALKLTQQDIEIIVGLAHRKKTIKIHAALTLQDVYAALYLVYQPTFIDLS
jgi:hypothetical protein